MNQFDLQEETHLCELHLERLIMRKIRHSGKWGEGDLSDTGWVPKAQFEKWTTGSLQTWRCSAPEPPLPWLSGTLLNRMSAERTALGHNEDSFTRPLISFWKHPDFMDEESRSSSPSSTGNPVLRGAASLANGKSSQLLISDNKMSWSFGNISDSQRACMEHAHTQWCTVRLLWQQIMSELSFTLPALNGSIRSNTQSTQSYPWRLWSANSGDLKANTGR